jgi:glycosyltransferase involved in cell wall biosynthesis
VRRANGPNDLLILIPAFNESGAITGVIHEVRGVVPDAPILVVDDASNDGTYDLAKSAACCDWVIILAWGGAFKLDTSWHLNWVMRT